MPSINGRRFLRREAPALVVMLFAERNRYNSEVEW